MPSLAVLMRLAREESTIVEIEEFDFGKHIGDLKKAISSITGAEKDTLELIYCGNILEDYMTVNSCGLKSGVMVHALKKKPKEIPMPSQAMSEQDIKALVIAFRTLSFNPLHRNSLQKLSRPDILENIIQITPGLINDPVAIALIQDPELMVRLANFDTVRRIVEQHPALAEAANHIAATVHEEALHTTISPSTSGYSLIELSDDDDMESSQSSDSIQPGMSRQASFSGITPAQLAAALASARDGRGSDASGTNITTEMVTEAMQRAIASVSTPRNSLGENQDENADASSELQEQMRRMRELGLLDDAVNLQALQVAGGNLQAAVDLVFSGAIGSDPPS